MIIEKLQGETEDCYKKGKGRRKKRRRSRRRRKGGWKRKRTEYYKTKNK